MIEIIYNKEKESAVGNEEYFCIPRNIRQIGQPSEECKIYVEDYVYSFLSKDWKEEENKGKIAILLGKCNWKDGIFYIFVKSTIMIESTEVTNEYISIKDETWGKIYEEMKEYFPGQDVVGWYLSLPGGNLKITDMINRIHLNHFGGNDKILYLADPEEQDNAFFIYRNNRLDKQKGYYIFYEKNEPMQEYILEKNPKASVDYTGKAQDRAVNDFRKIIARKREEKKTKNTNKVFSVITAGAAVLVVVLGVMWLQKSDLKDNNILKNANNSMIESVKEETTTSQVDITSDVDDSVLHEVLVEDVIIEEKEIAEKLEEDITVSEDLNKENAELNSETSEIAKTSETSVSTSYTEYTIREGDTLSNISMRYYGDLSKLAEICKINSMKEEDTIYPGQKILLP